MESFRLTRTDRQRVAINDLLSGSPRAEMAPRCCKYIKIIDNDCHLPLYRAVLIIMTGKWALDCDGAVCVYV